MFGLCDLLSEPSVYIYLDYYNSSTIYAITSSVFWSREKLFYADMQHFTVVKCLRHNYLK